MFISLPSFVEGEVVPCIINANNIQFCVSSGSNSVIILSDGFEIEVDCPIADLINLLNKEQKNV